MFFGYTDGYCLSLGFQLQTQQSKHNLNVKQYFTFRTCKFEAKYTKNICSELPKYTILGNQCHLMIPFTETLGKGWPGGQQRATKTISVTAQSA